MSGLLVIGIGNADCGDDALGPMVARRLTGLLPSSVSVLKRSGDMLGLIEDWAGCDGVVLIDAAAMVSEPGTIHRVDLLRDGLPAGLALGSTHALGVAEAVRLAGVLGRLPNRLIAYAVEGSVFEPGAPPSAAVAAAVPKVVARVALEVQRFAGARVAAVASRSAAK